MGLKGPDAPTFNVLADDVSRGFDGGFVRFSRATIREFFLPITVTGTTRPEMMKLKRQFIAALNPRKGLVTLQTTEYAEIGGLLVAETARAITCYYAGGMEGGEGFSRRCPLGQVRPGPASARPVPPAPQPGRGEFRTFDVLRPF